MDHNKSSRNKPKGNVKRRPKKTEKDIMVNVPIDSRATLISEIADKIHIHPSTFQQQFENEKEYVYFIPTPQSIPGSLDHKMINLRGKEFHHVLYQVKDLLNSGHKISTIYYYFPDSKMIVCFIDEIFYVIDYTDHNHAFPYNTLIVVHTGKVFSLDDKIIVNKKLIERLIIQSKPLFEKAKNQRIKGICNYCKLLSNDKLSKCSGCQKVYYCNVDCQKRDWPNHKPSCLEIQKNKTKDI